MPIQLGYSVQAVSPHYRIGGGGLQSQGRPQEAKNSGRHCYHETLSNVFCVQSMMSCAVFSPHRFEKIQITVLHHFLGKNWSKQRLRVNAHAQKQLPWHICMRLSRVLLMLGENTESWTEILGGGRNTGKARFLSQRGKSDHAHQTIQGLQLLQNMINQLLNKRHPDIMEKSCSCRWLLLL